MKPQSTLCSTPLPTSQASPDESLAERVQREAAEATALPGWFWPAAAAVLAATMGLCELVVTGWPQ